MRAVVGAERVLGEEDQRVEDVLAVDLDDLELGQEEFGQRKGRAGQREAVAEVEAVAHLEAVHEDVDRPIARDIHEVRLLAAEQRVVPLVRRVALRGEELIEGAAVAGAGREVEIDLDAPGAGRPVGRVRTDRHAAHQTDEQSAHRGGIDDPQRFSQWVCQRSYVARVVRAAGHGPSLQPGT